MSVIISTFAELERELAKRGARMMSRCEPGKDRHRVLVTLHAAVVAPDKTRKEIEVFFVGETLTAATAGAFAKLDFQITKINTAGKGPG